MSFATNRRKWTNLFRSSSRKQRRSESKAGLRVTQLEDRVTPALTAILSGTTLSIAEVVGATHDLSVTVVGADLRISDDSDLFIAPPVGGVLLDGGRTVSIPVASVSLLTIDAGLGDDKYTVASNQLPASLSVFLSDSSGSNRYVYDLSGSGSTMFSTGGSGELSVTATGKGTASQSNTSGGYNFNLTNTAANSLNIQLNGGGAANGQADTTTLGRSGANLSGSLSDASIGLFLNFLIPFADIAGITVNGTADNDILAIDFSGGDVPTFNYSASGGTDSVRTVGANNVGLFRNGAMVDVVDTDAKYTGGTTKFSVPFAAIASANIVGSAATNTSLAVNYNGGALPTVNYQGGAGGNDDLSIVGGSTTTQTFNFTNNNDGSVVLAGAIAGTVNYTGLEPVTSTITAANVILNYGAASETITFTDAGGGQTMVDSTAGESVTFANPTDLLEINAGAGDDTVTVTSFGTGFGATLDIDGEGNSDTVNLNAAVTYAAGKNLTVAGETISVTAAQTLSGGGDISLTAGRNITVSAALDADAISLDADTGAQVAGSFAGVLIGANITGTGAVTIEGRGGDTGSAQDGVAVGATVSGATTTFAGRGGTGTGTQNTGVFVGGGGSITSSGGTVSVTGFGGGTGASDQNDGVRVEGGTITAGGAGTVSVTGTGGTGTGGLNHGVLVFTAGATITSGGGNVSVTGTAGTGGGNNNGVWVLNGSVSAPAALAVSGTAASDTGILVNDTISSVGLATLTGPSGSSISIPAAATANFGSLTATTTGTASIAEDSATVLDGGNVGGTFTLSASGGITQTAAVTAGSFSATNATAGAILLAASSNAVGTFAASNTAAGGAATMKFAAGGTIGTVGSVSGITTAGGTVSVSTAATGTISLNSPIATSGGQVGVSASPAGSSINLGANIDTTGGANAGPVLLTSANALSLTNSITIHSDNAAGTDGLVQILDPVNANAVGRSLTITAGTGNVTLSNVGATNALLGLSVTGGVLSVGSLGASTGGISLSGAGIILTGVNVRSDRTENTAGQGTTAGTISLNGAVTLSTGVTVDTDATTTDASITFASGSSIDGANFLSLLSGTANIVLNNTTVGGTTPLTSFMANGAAVTGTGDMSVTSGINVTNSAASSLAGAISGTGAVFAKLGTGTLTLGGANTYTGTTSVFNGRLDVDGSTTSNTTVLAPGILGGTGSLTGSVTGNGTVSPGNSPGILATGNFGPVGTLAIELNGTTVGAQYDQVNVTGSVDASATVLSISLGFSPAIGDTFTIVNNDAGDAVSGFFLGLVEGKVFTAGGATFQITYQGGDGNDIELTTLDGANPTFDGTPGADTFVVSRNGANVETRLNGNLIDSRAFAGLNTITVNGLAGNDSLTVDYTGGNPIPSGGLSYAGGTQTGTPGDSLSLLNGSTTSVAHNFTNENDGTVVLTGALAGTISYTGLEPITDNLDAANRTFTFNDAGNETITLSDSGGADGMMTIDSNIGGESVTFTVPTTSLTISATSGTDSLTVTGSDAALAASVTATTSGSITVNGGGLNNTAGTAAISLTSTTGGIDISGSGVQSNSTVSLTATAGAITTGGAATDVVATDLTASAATGIDLDTNVNTIVATTTGAGSILLDEANAVTLTNVTAANGKIAVTAGGTITVTSVVSTTDTDANDIEITATAGNILLRTVNAGTTSGDVTIAATVGSVLDVNFPAGPAVNLITGDVVTLSAGGEIGQPTVGKGFINTTANSWVLTANDVSAIAAKGIWVVDSDSVTVTSALTTDGIVFLNAANNMLVTFAKSQGATRDVRLNSTVSGNITLVDVIAGRNAIITATNGGILDDNVNTTIASAVGSITLTANAGAIGALGATGQIDTSAGSITASSANGIWITETDAVTITSATTTNGDIEIQSGGTMTATTATAGGAGKNVRLTTTAGDIALSLATAAGDGVLLQAAGAITDGNGAANNVDATNLITVSSTGTALDTTIANLSSSNTTSGSVTIANTGNLTIATVGPIFGVTQSGVSNTGGAVVVSTGKAGSDALLTVNANVSASGNVTLSSDQDFAHNATFSIASSGGTVSINADVAADADATGATVTIGGTISAATTTITTGADSDTVTISGAIDGTAASVLTGDAADSITVNTTGTAPLTLDGQNAGDTYTVNVGTLNAQVNVADTGAGGTDTLNVNGTAAADTFEVNTAAGGDATVEVNGDQVVTYTKSLEVLNLDGLALGDTYNIFFAQPAATSFLPALVNIVDTGASAGDVANLSGTDNADILDVNFSATRTTKSAAETVTYLNGNLETLNVFSKAASDVVLAKAVTKAGGGPVVNLDGGTPTAPTTLPGDILVLDVTGMVGLSTADIKTPAGSIPSTSHNNLTWVEFETIPVPIGLGGTFDFGTGTSPTQPAPYAVPPAVAAVAPYWRSVVGTNLYAGFFGWNLAANSYDRGANSPNPTKTAFQNLLRDGNWFGPINVARTFSVAAVAAGDYQVSVTIGDTAVVMDSVFVTIEGLATPIAVPTAFQNQFVTVTGIGSDANADGKIGITFVDKAGTHSYWHVNAVDVRPVGLVSPVTITRADGMATALTADGLTKTTYFAEGFFPNAIVTATATNGSIASVDVDPFLVGVQVTADANGKATFQLLHPTGNGDVTLAATAAVVGDARGTFTQTFTLSAAQKIDFGSPTTPVEAGYLGFTNTLYAGSATNGLGWLNPVQIGDRGAAVAGSTPLFRDFVFNLQGAANKGDFNIDLPSAAPQFVTVYLGDLGTARDRMQVEVFNGATFSVAATEIASTKVNSLTFAVTPYDIGGGNFQTRLRFSDLGGTQNGWSVLGLEYRAAQGALVATPTAAVAGDGTTVTNYALTGGPAGGLVTLSSKFGAIQGTDASTLYDGFQVLLDGSGVGAFAIKSPVVAAGSLASAVGLVTVTGSHAGGFTQQYAGAKVSYDFGTASSPVAGGFTFLAGTQIATAQNGVGFAAVAGAFDRAPASFPAVNATANPDLFRDGVTGAGAGTFRVLVQAGATAVPVRVYAYDANSTLGNLTVTGEGGATQTLPTSLTVPAVFNIVASDANNDGFLDISIAGFSTWVMNGIEVG